MNYGQLALGLDAQSRPVDAAWAYEIAIHAPNADLDLFTNLVALYMVSSDGGYLAHHRLSDAFVRVSFTRANEVLDLAELRLGNQVEIAFWRNYIREMVLYEDVDLNVYEALVSPGSCLLPQFRVYMGSNGTQYRKEAQLLRAEVKDATTEKKRFIKSVLDGPTFRL